MRGAAATQQSSKAAKKHSSKAGKQRSREVGKWEHRSRKADFDGTRRPDFDGTGGSDFDGKMVMSEGARHRPEGRCHGGSDANVQRRESLCHRDQGKDKDEG